METRIEKNIDHAIKLLKTNQVVAIPTETVYGLAGNALHPETILKIYEVKQRPRFDPLIVHTDQLQKMEKFVEYIPDIIYKLAESFSPGPLTFVLPKTAAIPDLVTSGLASVAVRIPDHSKTLELLSQLDFPLAAPSANLFGQISPTKAKHVFHQLQNKIPLIIDGGECRVGIESTIVRYKNNQLEVLRLGGTTIDQLKRICKDIAVVTEQSEQIHAPGQLKSHYATRTPMIVGDIPQLLEQYKQKDCAVLSFSKSYTSGKKQIILSEKAELSEAAKKLFNAMHVLDSLQADIILTEEFPPVGLGLAINDRLRRASYREY
jgi:L-threonylcarbamoyladenylate synthase